MTEDDLKNRIAGCQELPARAEPRRRAIEAALQSFDRAQAVDMAPERELVVLHLRSPRAGAQSAMATAPDAARNVIMLPARAPSMKEP
ncbi:MAG TPA: hypothetical protein PK264_17725, partial [Hyphomicrobiaceae bacterium]|nr:hypothetical protein [Hyphomicrobiaceae bacterium]